MKDARTVSGERPAGTRGDQSVQDSEDDLRERQERVELRIADLQAQRLRHKIAASEERLERAYRNAHLAEVSAYHALNACRKAYLRAAQAHDRAAETYERLAAARHGDAAAHRKMVEFHRVAAEADRQRAAELPEERPPASQQN